MISTNIFSKKPDVDGFFYAGYSIRLLANMLDLFVIILVLCLAFAAFSDVTDYELQIRNGYKNVPTEIQQMIIDNENGLVSDDELVKALLVESLKQILPYLLFSVFLVSTYYVGLWYYQGATLGKKFLQLKLIDIASKGERRPSLFSLYLRFFGHVFCVLSLGLFFLLANFNRKKRTIGDYLAGTAVILDVEDYEQYNKKFIKWQSIFAVIFLIIVLILFNS